MASPPRLWVSPLSDNVSDSDIRSLFSKYGNVVHLSRRSNYAFIEFDDPHDAEEAEHSLDGYRFYGTKILVQKARHRDDRHRSDRHVPRVSRDRYYDDARDNHYDYHSSTSSNRYGHGYYREPSYNSSHRDERREPGYRRSHSPVRDDRDSHLRRFSPPRNTEHRIYVEDVTRDITWKDLKDHFRICGDVCFADVKPYGDRFRGIVEFKFREDMDRALHELHNSRIRGVAIYLSTGDREPLSTKSISRSPSPRPSYRESSRNSYRNEASPRPSYRNEFSPRPSYRNEFSPRPSYRNQASPRPSYRNDPSPRPSYRDSSPSPAPHKPSPDRTYHPSSTRYSPPEINGNDIKSPVSDNH